MNVYGVGWCGVRTDRGEQLARFYAAVLGLKLVVAEVDFWMFETADGTPVEIFGPDQDRDYFTSGPVIGFSVPDLPQAVEELRAAGVELVGEPGPTWQHFRGPDGNIYELTT